jgi:hypothetical protein
MYSTPHGVVGHPATIMKLVTRLRHEGLEAREDGAIR